MQHIVLMHSFYGMGDMLTRSQWVVSNYDTHCDKRAHWYFDVKL